MGGEHSPPPRARPLEPTPLSWLMPPTDFTELMLLFPTEFTPSTPLSPTTELPTLTTPLLRSMLMRFPPTPTPTPSLTTTPRPPSTLRSSPMVPPTLPEDTQLLFPTAGSSM